MFGNAIKSLDWLWEPEITAEIDSQVQAIVNGATEPRSAGAAVEAVAQELRSPAEATTPDQIKSRQPDLRDLDHDMSRSKRYRNSVPVSWTESAHRLPATAAS